MKKLIPFILFAISTSSSLLLKVEGGVINEGESNNQTLLLEKNSIPIFQPDLPSSISYLGITPQLMMNPSLEEGTKAIGEALGIFGRSVITAEGTAVEGRSAGEGINNIVNAVSSNNVLRLRGGGPKKSQPKGGLKTTGDSSDEEDAPDLESEDTQQMNSEVSKYLKKEIINNIYEECLAEVANMSSGATHTHVKGENSSKEAAEWAAAAQAAEYSKEKVERAFQKAEREIDEAKSIADEAKRNVRELERVPKPAGLMEQAIAAATIEYEKAYAAHAAIDYKAKKLAGELAEARVETASAVLQAIMMRKSAQHATTAEDELETAKEAEEEVLKAAEAAKSDVAAKAVLMNNAEANLNAAKQAAHGAKETTGSNGNNSPNAAPPMTAAQRAALREIEQDKAAAEEVRARAKKAEISANSVKSKIYEMNFEKELQAYHQAEEAWRETVEGYKNALAHAQDAGLDEEELALSVAKAEVQQAAWRADARWVKARQADQMVDSKYVAPLSRTAIHGAVPDYFIAAKNAWAHAAEGYKMAIEKATKSNLKSVELTASLNNALSAYQRVENAIIDKTRVAEKTAKIQNAQKVWDNWTCQRASIAGQQKSAARALDLYISSATESVRYADIAAAALNAIPPSENVSLEKILQDDVATTEAKVGKIRSKSDIIAAALGAVPPSENTTTEAKVAIAKIERDTQPAINATEQAANQAYEALISAASDAFNAMKTCVDSEYTGGNHSCWGDKYKFYSPNSCIQFDPPKYSINSGNGGIIDYVTLIAADASTTAALCLNSGNANRGTYGSKVTAAAKACSDPASRISNLSSNFKRAADAAYQLYYEVRGRISEIEKAAKAEAEAIRAKARVREASMHKANFDIGKIANQGVNFANNVAKAASDYAAITADAYKVQHFVESAQQCAAVDTATGVFIRQHWTTALSAFEQERAAWEVLASSASVWKERADQWEAIEAYWRNYAKAAQIENSSQMLTAHQQVLTAIDALKTHLTDQAAATAMLTEAQKATKKATQAFDALKVVRDAAYAAAATKETSLNNMTNVGRVDPILRQTNLKSHVNEQTYSKSPTKGNFQRKNVRNSDSEDSGSED